jgi:hypothetical protein
MPSGTRSDVPSTIPIAPSRAPPVPWTAADLALIVAVTAMGVAVAYLRNPEHKATVLMLPVPFTLAMLAVGRPIDATNVVAIPALFGYTLLVWALRERCGLPILAAIAIAAASYCLAGAAASRWMPTGPAAFWTAIAATMVAGVALVRKLPHRSEPHHRTPLPVWIKAPAIAAVICGLLAIKQQLGGFTTMFPMVGVVASYESRHSLWTIVRRIAWLLVLMAPMMAAIRLWQDRVGVPWALVLAWPVMLAGLLIWHRRFAGRPPGTDAADFP